MPFIRATSRVSPTDGVTPGFWVQLSTDPPGTWKGLSQSQWPAVAGGDTLASYATKLSQAYQITLTEAIGQVSLVAAIVTFVVIQLSPLIVGDITVSNQDFQIFSTVR